MNDQDPFDVDDIEAFIKGLKDTFDSLDEKDLKNSQGMQIQLAKAISLLRTKKIDKIEQVPKFDFETRASKEVLKNFLLNKLEFLKNHLDSEEISITRKFNLVMQITKLRTKISQLLKDD
ncbi:MAG: hypothetical protein ACFFAH_03410 [Promethearchaeota archaeon]